MKTTHKINEFTIEIFSDSNFSQNSADNLYDYDFIYFDEKEYIFPNKIGIRVFENDKLLKSAIIGSFGGGGIYQNSIIFESDKVLICCTDLVFCLSIPKLNLEWKTKADEICCFEIFQHKSGYIIHGEMEISKIDKNGEIIWAKSGADIFVTQNGENNLEFNENFISVRDWNNKVYKFDYNGNEIH